jgi:hypothetical protein
MRRVKIVSAKPSSSSVEGLRLKYQSFKKQHPGAQARVPREIKMLAQSIIESGSKTVNALAKDIGLSPTSVRSWLKTLCKTSKRSRKRTTPLQSGKASLPNTVNAADEVGTQIKKEIARLRESISHFEGRIPCFNLLSPWFSSL